MSDTDLQPALTAPERSPLRQVALYYARGMISIDEYRPFRRQFIDAIEAGTAPPEVPEHWHVAPPGQYFPDRADEDERPQRPGPLGDKRRVAVVVSAATVIGAVLAWYLVSAAH